MFDEEIGLFVLISQSAARRQSLDDGTRGEYVNLWQI